MYIYIMTARGPCVIALKRPPTTIETGIETTIETQTIKTEAIENDPIKKPLHMVP